MENLAPAGNFAALERACAGGAGAVYLGFSAFSARAGAGNFNREELREYDPLSLFERVVLPKSISYIDERAFYGCIYLTNLDFPEGNKWLQSIGEYAFAWAGPTELTIPKTLRTISPHAFEYSGLGYVEFEEGNEHLTEIPEYCFRGSSLIRVKFSPEIEVIGTMPSQNVPIWNLRNFLMVWELSENVLSGNISTGSHSRFQRPSWISENMPSAAM